MPNFPSIYLELQELWKNLRSAQNQIGELDVLETRVDTVESAIGTLQDKTQCISRTNDPTNSTVIGCDLTVNANTTLGREDESDIVTIKAIAAAPTTDGYKVLTIEDSTGLVKKETFANAVAAGGGGGGSGLPAWSQQDYKLSLPYPTSVGIGNNQTFYEQKSFNFGDTECPFLEIIVSEVMGGGYLTGGSIFTRIGNNINLKYELVANVLDTENPNSYAYFMMQPPYSLQKLPYLKDGYNGSITYNSLIYTGYPIVSAIATCLAYFVPECGDPVPRLILQRVLNKNSAELNFGEEALVGQTISKLTVEVNYHFGYYNNETPIEYPDYCYVPS